MVARALGALTGSSLRARNNDERDVCHGPADLSKLNLVSAGIYRATLNYYYLKVSIYTFTKRKVSLFIGDVQFE